MQLSSNGLIASEVAQDIDSNNSNTSKFLTILLLSSRSYCDNKVDVGV